MHHQLDATTLLRQRAAEIDRIVAARHHQARQGGRTTPTRSAFRRALDQLRAA